MIHVRWRIFFGEMYDITKYLRGGCVKMSSTFRLIPVLEFSRMGKDNKEIRDVKTWCGTMVFAREFEPLTAILYLVKYIRVSKYYASSEFVRYTGLS